MGELLLLQEIEAQRGEKGFYQSKQSDAKMAKNVHWGEQSELTLILKQPVGDCDYAWEVRTTSSPGETDHPEINFRTKWQGQI